MRARATTGDGRARAPGVRGCGAGTPGWVGVLNPQSSPREVKEICVTEECVSVTGAARVLDWPKSEKCRK